jgi:hypothetical protein
MAASDFALHQAVIRVASTLEQVRVICDRTHEENLLADREGRAAECHYAYALGAIWQIVSQELERLQAIGVKRQESHEEANARAMASLEAFRRSLPGLLK